MTEAESEILWRSMERELTERERKILFLLHGLDDGEIRTPVEIGLLLALHADEITEMADRAAEKLRGIPEVEATEFFAIVGRLLESGQPARGLSLTIEPGDATAEDLARLYSALSDLYRSYGGPGLVFRKPAEIEIIAGVIG